MRGTTMRPYPNFRILERLSGITWADLTAQEPQLVELLWKAQQASTTCRGCSDLDRTFAPIRDALVELVGFAGRNHWHPVLGGSRAHAVAYWKLYDIVACLLPAARAGEAGEMRDRQREEAVAETGVTAPAALISAPAIC
jgi:hypothetical protein